MRDSKFYEVLTYKNGHRNGDPVCVIRVWEDDSKYDTLQEHLKYTHGLSYLLSKSKYSFGFVELNDCELAELKFTDISIKKIRFNNILNDYEKAIEIICCINNTPQTL